ncbi:MAG: exodeoxyribonuclease I, partial [Sphaerochaetaceae bacterium]|nr:exodeoxyribonuclease I [Sphaerochaetaceae bacterium]
INMAQCQENYKKLTEHPIVAVNIRKAVDAEEFPVVDDVDHTLYSGSFFSDADAKRFKEIRSLPPEELWSKRFNFDDQRAHEMLWRYQCRNWPEKLSEEEEKRWKSFCAQRLIQPPGNTPVTLEFYARKIAERMASNDTTPQDKEVLSKLEAWGRDLCARIGLTYPR